MSDAEIFFTLDDEDATYRPGEEIAGTVHLRTESELEPTDLQLELEWYTGGRGSTNRETVETAHFQTEALGAGEEGEHRFSFEAPGGPFTYVGELVDVHWRIRATLDASWIGDPTAQVALTLEPGPTDALDWGGTSTHSERVGDTGGAASVRWGALIFGLLIAVVPPIYVFGFIEDPLGRMMGTIGVIIFSGGGLYFVYRAVRNAIAGARLGDLDVTIEPEAVEPGSTLSVHIGITPDSSVSLQGIDAVLVGRERVEYSDARDDTSRDRTAHHRFHESNETLSEARGATLRAGENTEYELEFPIPETAPTTFHAPSNDIEWQLELTVSIPHWPDLVHHEPIVVRPPATERTDEEAGRASSAR